MKRFLLWSTLLPVMMIMAACESGGGDVEPVPEFEAPVINSCSVEDGAQNVSVELGRISLYASAPVQVVNESLFSLRSDGGKYVELNITTANTNVHCSFGELENNANYTFTVQSGAIAHAIDKTAVCQAKVEIHFSTPFKIPSQVDVNPDATLTNPNASQRAKELYTYIRNELFLGGYIATGTMSKYTTKFDEAEWVYQQTGKYPAIHCFDLMNLTGKEWLEDYNDLLPNYRAWTEAGGIVAGMWHWRDPSKQTNEFYTSDCSFHHLGRIIKKANGDGTYEYDTSSLEYQYIMKDIAEAKKKLQLLEDANIPVLWRPLHEARGNQWGAWFWWGADGGEACKALWMLLRREMADLDNLIWVWTIQADGEVQAAQAWYPGADNVDMVGVDIYNEAPMRGSFATEYRFAAAISGQRKVIVLSECGAMPDVAAMARDDVHWAYCMPWYGEHSQSDTYNGAAYWRRMHTGDFADSVIDRSEVNF